MATEADLTVRENTAKRRFEVMVDGEAAYVTFKREEGRITFLHTFVSASLEGQGIAGRLAEYGLEHARKHGLVVVPVCPYVRGYVERHPEYQDLVE